MIDGTLNSTVRLQRSPTALFTELPEGFVLMDIKQGKYFSLNETGSEIWRALEVPISKTEIIRSLCNRFVIEPEVCSDRVAPFIDTLLGHGIIEAIPESLPKK